MRNSSGGREVKHKEGQTKFSGKSLQETTRMAALYSTRRKYTTLTLKSLQRPLDFALNLTQSRYKIVKKNLLLYSFKAGCSLAVIRNGE